MAGLCVLAVGIWAWNEKDMFSNLAKLTFIALDPAFVLICTGTVTFIIGFTGSVGALRENTCLLAMVSYVMGKGIAKHLMSFYAGDCGKQVKN